MLCINCIPKACCTSQPLVMVPAADPGSGEGGRGGGGGGGGSGQIFRLHYPDVLVI